MWLQKGAQVPVLVPERMPETIQRCLADGWVEIADPTVVAIEPEPVVVEVIEQERILAVKAANDDARAAFDDMGMGRSRKAGVSLCQCVPA